MHARLIRLLATAVTVPFLACRAADFAPGAAGFEQWLAANRDPATGLPYSHVGDPKLARWTITYDSAVVAMAFLAAGRADDAHRIIQYYDSTPAVWRLGGIIEAFIPGTPPRARDWSVRTGANLWMGLAAFHVHRATCEPRPLALAFRLAEFAAALQNSDSNSAQFGGIALGPAGNPKHAGDQHLGSRGDQPAFTNVYATEIQLDAYALFSALASLDPGSPFAERRDRVLGWIRRNAVNAQAPRLNRGGGDDSVATDIQSWGLSALGPAALDAIRPGLTADMAAFVESNCVAELTVSRPDGGTATVSGCDFVDRAKAGRLGRPPVISPEWTFQFAVACGRLADEANRNGQPAAAAAYRTHREQLIQSMLTLAVPDSGGLGLPYATTANAEIGHENRTPAEGTLSAIGPAYGILAIHGFDPLAPEFPPR